MHFCGLGGEIWLLQFVRGFPRTGKLSQKFTFPLPTKKIPDPMSLNEVIASAPGRFRSRSTRPPPQAEVLRNEALLQAERGWLGPPRLLSADGLFADAPTVPLNNAFRFAVDQSSKVRACDDLKDSLTNRLCSVGTPITLPGWDLLAAMSQLIAVSPKEDWAFVKGDDTSAYKNLPLRHSDSHLASIALWGPGCKDWFGFLPRTLMFGATASVLRYNVFSRILAAFFNRLFGIPIVAFYDDLGPPMIFELVQEALQLVTEVSQLIGVISNTIKCEWGNPLSFLGLLGSHPNRTNGWTLSLSLTIEKVHKCPCEIEAFFENWSGNFCGTTEIHWEIIFRAIYGIREMCALLYARYMIGYIPLIIQRPLPLKLLKFPAGGLGFYAHFAHGLSLYGHGIHSSLY